ncbi:MAG: aminoacyl-tRNA hydrolase [Patescibacteria group bacterium]|nr:aminoacyl-tRNA hydrolase [Patescibacteria group bacterium]
MTVLFGLGNPGKKYEKTRHNAGFMFMDKIREYLGWDQFYNVGDWEVEENLRAQICKARGGRDREILLAKPMLFMNTSGQAAKRIVTRLEIKVSKGLVIAHDDLDIELGKFKIQKGVSPKDHKGVKGVEMALETRDFLRVRLGVDNRGGDRQQPGDEYVLAPMTNDEILLLDEGMADAVKQLRSVAGF